MFLILREYDVKQGCQEQFERVYGPDGDWPNCFRTIPLTNELSSCAILFPDVIYLTCDFWETREA